jgi:hypothetical protein
VDPKKFRTAASSKSRNVQQSLKLGVLAHVWSKHPICVKSSQNILAISISPAPRSGGRVAEDGDDAPGILVDVHEGVALNTVVTFPADGQPRARLLEVEIFRIVIPRPRPAMPAC